MTILMDYTKDELAEIFSAYKEPKFRGEQVYTAIFNGKNYGDKMNLPKQLLLSLQEKNAVLQPVTIHKVVSSSGSATKFLFALIDGNIIEGVLMEYKFGNTICVSTQVGCKMNCSFCASGSEGFVRNLTAGEIMGQVVAVNAHLGGKLSDRKITNIVLMGSGEPLDNFMNVVKFLKIATKESFNFSVRNISVSTCGIPKKIEDLADTGYHVTLAVSLHAPNDTIRKQIMPIAKSYPIASVVESAKYYNTVTNRRVIFEYALIDGVNNKTVHAKQLADLLEDVPCHVNLIRLNEVAGKKYKSASMESCKTFLASLQRFQVSATLRRTLGDDIEGACGQLKNRELKNVGK